MNKLHTALALALTAGASVQAGTPTWFTPLTQSAPVVAPNAPEELTEPWVSPAGIAQRNVISMRLVEDQVLSYGQSIGRAPGAGTSASMFDMIAYDHTGNFLFVPHESPWGAGVSRVNLYSGDTHVLFAGDNGGQTNNWAHDYGAFDPARFTPNGTVFAAEEWAGLGRVIEIMNPFADPTNIVTRELHSIANVSHEGINFSTKYNDTIYFIDENNSGSIYKFVMWTPGVYTVGQTFVLSVDNFAATGGSASLNWNSGSNVSAARTGAATWVPLTDELGNVLPGIRDPFAAASIGTVGGRFAADDVAATPYGRPEDGEVIRLANGNEGFAFTATSENSVYVIEILEENVAGRWERIGRRWFWRPAHVSRNKAIVRAMVTPNTPTNVGFAPTTGVLNSPDNLAQDALGNIYIIEDAPNSSSTGGDIWFIRDVNNDGVAESIDHFLSIRVAGSEATGMIFNPVFPEEFVVAVQHPSSTDLGNVPNGLGDSVWMFHLSNIPNQTFLNQLRSAAQ